VERRRSNTQTGKSLNEGPNDASTAFANPSSGGFDHAGCFTSGAGTPTPVDGAELRVSWRYGVAPSSPPVLHEVGMATGRTPIIDQARLRCLAPVRVLATDRAR
jgi:hypothetical protein